MHVTLLGPGRLGRSLHQLLAGSAIDTTLVGREGVLPESTDAVLLTVPDRAIAAAAQQVPRHLTVLHTSGATDLRPLQAHPEHGSFHPLMTFPGPEIGIPKLHDAFAALAGTPRALQIGRSLAEALGMQAAIVSGDRRLYHAAAVIAGNFATTLLAEAGEVLGRAGVDPRTARRMLLPLAVASLRNAVDDPAEALTGPVARADEVTMDRHRAGLRDAGLDDTAALYDTLVHRTRVLLGHDPPE